MIYIAQNSSNKIVLTLTEVTTVTNPSYLFVFTNEFDTNTGTQILFTAADTSSYPERYNLFNLVEPTDLSLVVGQYTYQIYEKSGPFTTPLSIAQTTGVVIEEGRMVVSGPAPSSVYT
jgi:hypothetical protein